MSNFIKGITTFLITTIVGVVQYFYKAPAPTVIPPASVVAPSSTFSSVTSLPTTSSAVSIPSDVPPLNRNLEKPLFLRVSSTSPSLRSSSSLVTPSSTISPNINVTIPTIPSIANLPFLLPIATSVTPVPPPITPPSPPPPFLVSGPTIVNQPITPPVSTTTILTQQIAALVGLPLSVPQKQEPLNATGTALYKIFNFAIAANSFTPNAIIVQQGDLAQLNITSSIATSFESKDLQFGLAVKPGELSAVSIPATDIGTFVFYAQGANAQTIFGYFVVRART